MNNITHRVEVQGDHIAKVSSAKPDKAIAELIWNALDADAKKVEVFLDNSELGAGQITVRDNGNGFSYNEASSLFKHLGGSWKATKDRTDGGRFLHGKEGQGRFKAFALGRCVEWEILGKDTFKLTAFADKPEKFQIEKTTPQRERTTLLFLLSGVYVDTTNTTNNTMSIANA